MYVTTRLCITSLEIDRTEVLVK